MTTVERKNAFYEYVKNQTSKSKSKTKGRYIECLEKAYRQLIERRTTSVKEYPSVYDIDDISLLESIKSEPEFHRRKTSGGTPELRGLNLYIEFLYIIEDSYQAFFASFNIDVDAFFNWGIDNAIFPKDKEIKKEWNYLVERITTGCDKVFIRGYGRNARNTYLFIDLYKELFPLANVEVDRTNNAKPKRNLESMTKLRRNKNIYNYQISHIFGDTKNIFMFEAPWNICYLPKIIDPFTGHEAKGLFPTKFQKLFKKKVARKYRRYIDAYRKILSDYDVKGKMDQHFMLLKDDSKYLTDSEYRKTIDQFEKDAYSEIFGLLQNEKEKKNV